MNRLTNTPDYITHSIIRLLIMSIFLTGCTHFKPVEMNGNTLQDKLRNGELIEEGDCVRVITKDGSSHILTVTAINEHVLKGELEGTGIPSTRTEDGMYMEDPAREPTAIEILIDDIVLVEEEKISAGKTTLAAGGVLGAITLILFFPVIRYLLAK